MFEFDLSSIYPLVTVEHTVHFPDVKVRERLSSLAAALNTNYELPTDSGEVFSTFAKPQDDPGAWNRRHEWNTACLVGSNGIILGFFKMGIVNARLSVPHRFRPIGKDIITINMHDTRPEILFLASIYDEVSQALTNIGMLWTERRVVHMPKYQVNLRRSKVEDFRHSVKFKKKK